MHVDLSYYYYYYYYYYHHHHHHHYDHHHHHHHICYLSLLIVFSFCICVVFMFLFWLYNSHFCRWDSTFIVFLLNCFELNWIYAWYMKDVGKTTSLVFSTYTFLFTYFPAFSLRFLLVPSVLSSHYPHFHFTLARNKIFFVQPSNCSIMQGSVSVYRASLVTTFPKLSNKKRTHLWLTFINFCLCEIFETSQYL